MLALHCRRYHEDCENKYGQYQPGKISDNLRHALGLRPNQLPLYIYRMRVLGYPPGWLKEAEVHQADVKMYDATGRSKHMIFPINSKNSTRDSPIHCNSWLRILGVLLLEIFNYCFNNVQKAVSCAISFSMIYLM